MHWNPKWESSKTKKSHNPVSACQGRMTIYGGENASLNRKVWSWLLKFEMFCWDLTLIGSLFHSTGAGMAKPHLPMAFLGFYSVLFYTFIAFNLYQADSKAQHQNPILKKIIISKPLPSHWMD